MHKKTEALKLALETAEGIAVRDWPGGGCDINDIPRPEIAALVAFTDYGIKGDA